MSLNACYYDENDFKQLESIMDSWWETDGPAIALHTMNKTRVPFVKDALISTGVIPKDIADPSKPFNNLKILEVGCGGGICSEALAELGGTVHGIDNTESFISIANAHKILNPSLTNLKYFLTTIEEHNVNHFEEYDAVVLSEVVEHVTDKNSLFEESVKCLKPGGSIIVTTFNKTIVSWLFGILYAENVSGAIPRGTHDYEKFISPNDVEYILKKNNCNTVEVKGFRLGLFSAEWYWSYSTSINYALHATKNKN